MKYQINLRYHHVGRCCYISIFKIRPFAKYGLWLKRASFGPRDVFGKGYLNRGSSGVEGIYIDIYIYIYSQYCWFTLFITGKSSIVPNHQPVLLLPQSVDPLPTQYQRPHQSDVFSSPRRSESSAVAPSCGNCDVHERRGREQIEMPLNDLCRICMGSIGDLYGESFVC